MNYKKKMDRIKHKIKFWDGSYIEIDKDLILGLLTVLSAMALLIGGYIFLTQVCFIR